MLIDWAALGTVAIVSFLFAVAIVTAFSLGVLALSWVPGRRPGPDAPTPPDLPAAGRSGGIAVATACFAVCAAAGTYGLYLIVPQFH